MNFSHGKLDFDVCYQMCMFSGVITLISALGQRAQKGKKRFKCIIRYVYVGLSLLETVTAVFSWWDGNALDIP